MFRGTAHDPDVLHHFQDTGFCGTVPHKYRTSQHMTGSDYVKARNNFRKRFRRAHPCTVMPSFSSTYTKIGTTTAVEILQNEKLYKEFSPSL